MLADKRLTKRRKGTMQGEGEGKNEEERKKGKERVKWKMKKRGGKRRWGDIENGERIG